MTPYRSLTLLRILLLVAPAAPLAMQAPLAAQAPPAPDAVLTFQYDRPGLPVPSFLFTLHHDGTGTYAASVQPSPPDTARYGSYPASPTTPLPPTQVSRPISLSTQTTTQLFDAIHSTHNLHGGCESKAKNIASTGAKIITYSGPDGQARCAYNYTEIKSIASLTETFLAVAFTLDEGRKLELAHRYDRLGLDQEMRQLVDAVHEGRALELGNIAPVLTAIAEDSQLLERVRSRASSLLAVSSASR